jgi:choline kinase
MILAAGQGRRLGGAYPKCLATVGGRTLMQHQVDALLAHGLRSLVVVVGFRRQAVVEHLAPYRAVPGVHVQFVENPFYATVNNVYSLWAARALMEPGFVLLNCDVLFHPEVLARLLAAPHDSAIAVEHKRCGAEEMKVLLRGERVVRLSKDLDPAAAAGEYVGLARFGPEGARACAEALDEVVVRDRRHGEYYEEALNRVAQCTDIHAVDVSGLPVIEIDFPEDLDAARSRVYPQLAAARPAAL